ncbi:S-layer homology domain-containing protein [Arthrobacter bambusae]
MVLGLLTVGGVAAPSIAADTGSISGKVTVPAGVDVTKISVSSSGPSYVSVTPAADGSYAITGLAAGQYSVFFYYKGSGPSPIVSSYYPSGNYQNATKFNVSAGTAVTGINQALKAAAVISGTISVPAGAPQFTGYAQLMLGPDYTTPAVFGASSAVGYVGSGSFAVGGLPPGSYKLKFVSFENSLASMWHGGVATAESSPVINAAEGQTVAGVNDTAVRAATISGSVSGSTQWQDVTVVAADGSVVRHGSSGSDPSNYVVSGVFPGSYTVQFNRSSGYATNMEAQFYKDLPESAGIAGATQITVASGETRSDVNASSRVGGTLTGKILGADGNSLVNVPVRVYTKDGSLVTRGTSTAPDGTFTVTGLSTGKYLVSANMDPTHPSGALGPIFSGNVTSEAAATQVSTTVGQNTDIGTLSYATAGAGGPSFADVPAGAQFSSEIGWMASAGISTGWTEANGSKSFRPLTPVNRDAMAAFMYRLAGKPDFTPPATSPFTDVPTSSQFYKEITWLASKGVSTGWTEADGTKTYRPLQAVNRDAMAAFMYRLAGKPDFTPPGTSPFTDVPTSSQFYKEITWLAAQGISTGWTEAGGTKSYRPLNPVNRDAMAAFMYRYHTKFGTS